MRALKSSDGDVLLFNVHLSSKGGSSFEFPSSESELPDQYAKQLFNMSSPLPEHIRSAAAENFPVSENSRGFVFNADIVAVIRFLDIGTRPSNLRQRELAGTDHAWKFGECRHARAQRAAPIEIVSYQ
ncbi:MAG: hypothetical protein U0521_16235 [Anaerolineae bacterium]